MPGWKQRLKPAVSKKVLLGLAGALWLRRRATES